jgi:hypothetical protein
MVCPISHISHPWPFCFPQLVQITFRSSVEEIEDKVPCRDTYPFEGNWVRENTGSGVEGILIWTENQTPFMVDRSFHKLTFPRLISERDMFYRQSFRVYYLHEHAILPIDCLFPSRRVHPPVGEMEDTVPCRDMYPFEGNWVRENTGSGVETTLLNK